MASELDDCVSCGNVVDSDGLTTGDCFGGSGDRCLDCFFCYCDGSC